MKDIKEVFRALLEGKKVHYGFDCDWYLEILNGKLCIVMKHTNKQHTGSCPWPFLDNEKAEVYDSNQTIFGELNIGDVFILRETKFIKIPIFTIKNLGYSVKRNSVSLANGVSYYVDDSTEVSITNDKQS